MNEKINSGYNSAGIIINKSFSELISSFKKAIRKISGS